jgi:PatG C-terminal
MDPDDIADVSVREQAADGNGARPMVAAAPTGASASGTEPSPGDVSPQQGGEPCLSCGAVHPAGPPLADPYVYAIGRVEHSFATPGDEREFAQVMARADDTAGLTDQQLLHRGLVQHRYLARRACYVLTIGGVETYLLQPRDPFDLDLLVEAIRPRPSPLDVDVVIGVRGPIAPPGMCNGLMVPIVYVDQLYSFDRVTLQQSLPRPKNVSQTAFADTAEELMDRILQLADNAGSTDADRALNYLAVRYERIYEVVAEAHLRNQSLSSIDARPAALAGARRLVDVVFSFADRSTDVVDRWSVRVDVTEEFPYLASKLAPYTER